MSELGIVMLNGTTFSFRPQSTDLRIIDMVYARNEYHMPEDMKGMMVVDVGANIGTFAVLCAERGARVLAYEPEPDNFKMAITHKDDNVPLELDLYEVGLGALEGADTLYIHESNTGGHSTTEVVGPRSITVEVWPLRLMLPTAGNVDVLKLDCEGAEVYAIPEIALGLHERIKTIVMEFHNDNQVELRKMLEPYYVAENLFQADWRFTHR
jgi:FkbM family methyltransferase